ncbi:MAG: hypothetical protein AAGJ35_07335 [Myxococcota bacterium]
MTLKHKSQLNSALIAFWITMTWSCGCARAHRIPHPLPSNHTLRVGPVHIQFTSHNQSLPTFWAHRRFYLIGRSGQDYRIMIRNRSSKRLEVLTFVDGRDVISGARGNIHRHRGYILSPYAYVSIPGFRIHQGYVRAFRFAPKVYSYAGKRGDSFLHIGRIHFAIFQEKKRFWSRPYRPMIPQQHKRYTNKSRDHQHHRAPASGSAPTKNKKSFPTRHPHTTQRMGRRHMFIPQPQPGLGTARGQQIHAPAQYTSFVRASHNPSWSTTVRYNHCRAFRRQGLCRFSHHCSCRHHYRFHPYR